jgi:hypothetical protein
MNKDGPYPLRSYPELRLITDFIFTSHHFIFKLRGKATALLPHVKPNELLISIN